MKLNLLFTLAGSALVLSGCSSTTPARVESGPIRAQTFAFVNPGPKAVPAYADNTEYFHSSVQQAITSNLSAKGLTRVAAGGDVTVAYLMIVGNNATTTSINDYFGYAEDASALVAQAHDKATSSNNPNYFEVGTLVIDVVDSKSFSLLRRNFVSRQLHRQAPMEVRQARLQEAVNEALAGLKLTK